MQNLMLVHFLEQSKAVVALILICMAGWMAFKLVRRKPGDVAGVAVTVSVASFTLFVWWLAK
jgi:hypothetical protein